MVNVSENATYDFSNIKLFTQGADDTVCMRVNTETIGILKNIVYTDFFAQMIDRLYIFVIFALIINYIVYYFFKNDFFKLSIRLKFGFIVLLSLQLFIFIYMTYLKFLIYYNFWYLAVFFIMLLPLFYFLITFSEPLFDKIWKMDFFKLFGKLKR